jgi:hypothetical protein
MFPTLSYNTDDIINSDDDQIHNDFVLTMKDTQKSIL